MIPRHFWWLVETLAKQQGAGLTKDDRAEMRDLLNKAKRGDDF